MTTDAAHPITIKNHRSISRGQVVNGQSAGFEFNTLPNGKIINIDDSILIAYHNTSPAANNAAAQVLWTPINANVTVNVTNSKLDCPNNTTEIYSRGAVLNLIGTTRLNGTACRSISPP